MKKFYLFILPLIISGCSTVIQYVGATYPSTSKTPEIFVAESAIRQPFTIVGRGYIKTGFNDINWYKVQKEATKHARQHGADAILITENTAVSPIPSLISEGRLDSTSRGFKTKSSVETYYPLSTWHDILFLKYNK